RRARYADPRRRQIRRQRRAIAGRRGGAPAASACTLARHSASAGRHIVRHRPIAAAYAADVGVFRVRGRCAGPVRGARFAGMRRVYKKAAARRAEGGWGVALDGRPMRAPAKHELVVPSAALAEAIAAEWDSQRDEIRPATMPLTRLATTVIDRTRIQRDLVVADTAKYAGTDLVCYRAEHPPALITRQHAEWQPLIA